MFGTSNITLLPSTDLLAYDLPLISIVTVFLMPSGTVTVTTAVSLALIGSVTLMLKGVSTLYTQ